MVLNGYTSGATYCMYFDFHFMFQANLEQILAWGFALPTSELPWVFAWECVPSLFLFCHTFGLGFVSSPIERIWTQLLVIGLGMPKGFAQIWFVGFLPPSHLSPYLSPSHLLVSFHLLHDVRDDVGEPPDELIGAQRVAVAEADFSLADADLLLAEDTGRESAEKG